MATEAPKTQPAVEAHTNADAPKANVLDTIGLMAEKNQKTLLGVLVALLVVAAAWGYYQFMYMPEREAEAQDQMWTAVQFFEADSMDKAIKGTSQHLGLEALVDEYSGTKAGNQCRYYLGVAYLKQGKFAEGVAQLESFDKSENMVSAQAWAGIGFGYEEQKDMEKAAAAYEAAAAIKPSEALTPYYLMSAARCHEAAGKLGKALDAVKKIKNEYPISQEGYIADREIARLEGLMANQ